MSKESQYLDFYVMKYQDVVIRNAYVYVKDYHVAEDICQETFIRFEQKMETIPDEKVIRWLLRVSERLALDHLRKGKRRGENLSLEEYAGVLEDNRNTDASKMVIQREECEERLRVLDQLKEVRPNWHDALMMSYLEHKEIHRLERNWALHPLLSANGKSGDSAGSVKNMRNKMT